MKYVKLGTFILFFIFNIAFLNSQPLPCNTYGGTNSERCFALVQSLDSGYCLAGWTKSFGIGTPQFSNLLIVKTNQTGIPQWAKISIGSFDDEAYSMVRTFDGGYALCGFTNSYGIGTPNFANIFVLKLNSNGALQWAKVFGGDSNDRAYSIIETQDSGYVVCGFTTSFGMPPYPNIILLKLDKNGNLQWTNVYWLMIAPAEEEGYGITELKRAPPPFCYAVCGRFRISGQNNWNAFVMALDSIGRVLWVRDIVPEPYDEEAYSVVWDSIEQTIGVAGFTNSFGPGAPPFANLFVWRLTFFGNYIWANVYGWQENDEKVLDDKSLITTPDLGYAVCGFTKSAGPNAPPNPNFLILKLSPIGQIQWSRVHPSLPGANFEEAYPMVRTFNGGYAIAGFTNSFGIGGDDFHFLTLDPNGNRPACVLDTTPEIFEFPQVSDSMRQYRPMLTETLMPLRDTIVRYTEVCPVVKIDEKESKDFRINIFNSEIKITLLENRNIRLSLFDVTGSQIFIFAKGFLNKGYYSFPLPKHIKPGLYFLNIQTDGRRIIKILIF